MDEEKETTKTGPYRVRFRTKCEKLSKNEQNAKNRENWSFSMKLQLRNEHGERWIFLHHFKDNA